MIGLLLIFAGNVWAQCDPSDLFCRDQNQGSNGALDASRNSWKTQKVVYCDSTIVPMQKCKDLTPCSPRYLDCTKGPNRCICEIINPVAGGTTLELKSVVDRISTIPSLSTFSFVIKDPHFSDFVSLLNKAGPMTLFVPTNDAFQNAGVDTSNYQQMKEILKYHLVPNDALLTTSLFPSQTVTNADSDSIQVTKDQNTWMVDNAKVILPDVRVKNGVIWLIDRVLTPQTPQGFQAQDRSFSMAPNVQGLTQGSQRDFQLRQANLQGLSQSPQNFQQIMGQGQQAPHGLTQSQGVQGQALGQGQGQGLIQGQGLGQGFIQGQGLGQGFIQGQGLPVGAGLGQGFVQGQGRNQQGGQGFIQLQGQGQQGIVGVQQRSGGLGVDQGVINQNGQVKSIAERIMGNPQLTTFAFLLNDPRNSDIVQLLSGPGPVTVFIPTNEGFSKSGIDTTNAAMVRELLLHHIVPNMAVSSSDFVPLQNLFTAHGDKLKISQVTGWMVDDAKILVPDIQAKNGVIFLIDRVLMHPSQQTQLQNLGAGVQGFSASQGNVQPQGFLGFEGQGSSNLNQGNFQGSVQSTNRGVQGGPQLQTSRSSAQGQWHGAGLYCVAETELYYCNEKTECVLQEVCKNGCVQAAPGFPDYCLIPDRSAGTFQLPNVPNLQLPNLNQPPFQQQQGRSASG